jgi:hypothetical protein
MTMRTRRISKWRGTARQVFLSLREHGRKIHGTMQQTDKENIPCPNLIENQVAFKSGHAKTSDAGLLEIFPTASDFWMPDNPFKCFSGAVFKTNGKFRGNLAGESRDDFREVAFKDRTECGFHLAAARALAAISRSRARVPGRSAPDNPSSIIFCSVFDRSESSISKLNWMRARASWFKLRKFLSALAVNRSFISSVTPLT